MVAAQPVPLLHTLPVWTMRLSAMPVRAVMVPPTGARALSRTVTYVCHRALGKFWLLPSASLGPSETPAKSVVPVYAIATLPGSPAMDWLKMADPTSGRLTRTGMLHSVPGRPGGVNVGLFLGASIFE